MHLPTFRCDGESSFCIVKFGENRRNAYLMCCCLAPAALGCCLCLQERVLRCQDAIQSMASSAIDTVPPPKSASGRTSSPVPVPQSPVGVLDAGCLSYKSEDDAAAAAATVAASHGASGSSSSSPLVTSKRRKLTSRRVDCSDRSKCVPNDQSEL
jgi:cyclin D1/2/4